MTIPVEIMLRGNEQVFTASVSHAVDPHAWTEADAAAVLKGMLRAIQRVQQPGVGDADVTLRGLNWIVHPGQGGVVIALEIHSASAVAGPIALEEAALSRLIAKAVADAAPPAAVH